MIALQECDRRRLARFGGGVLLSLGDTSSAAAGSLTVEERGPIFGSAAGDRLLAASALAIAQAPAGMLVDWSFASGSASPVADGVFDGCRLRPP